MNAVLILLAYGILFPLPLLALLGIVQQRRKFVWERARYAHLRRIAQGGRR